MSLDRSLKAMGGMVRARSVLSRAERIAQLTEEGKFDPEENSPMGLPKVRVKHSRAGAKKKAAAAEGAEGAEGAPAAEGAAPAAAAGKAPAGAAGKAAAGKAPAAAAPAGKGAPAKGAEKKK